MVRLLTGLLFTAMCGFIVPAAAGKKLNVLLIVSDDLRPELGTYGGEAITPNLDALAAAHGSVRFDRAYVQQAICCPTRSSFLTSRRPDTTLVWDLHTQFRDAPGAARWKTLPQAFRDVGYRTAGMGKVFHPVPYRNASDDVAGGSWSEPYFQPSRSEDNQALTTTNCGVADAQQDDAQYSDGKTAAHAVATLQQLAPGAKDPTNPVPFFVAVGFHRPHLPWIAPSKYFNLYDNRTVRLADHNKRPQSYNVTGAQPWSWDPQSGPRHCLPMANKTAFPGEYDYVPDDVALHFRRSYFAAVSQMDAQVGKVLAELKAQGVEDETVVAFVGDHGWQLGDLGEFGKKTNFERSTRAPFIIRDPLSQAAGTGSSALVEFVDLMPTVMELALGKAAVPPLCPKVSDGAPSPPLCTEGRSLAAVMNDPAGTAAAFGAAFMQYPFCMHDEANHFDGHDGCRAGEPRVMGYVIRTRRWRYIEWVRFDKTTVPPTPLWNELLGTELYDHTAADTVHNVAESVNVVADPSLASTVAALSKQLHAGWRAARMDSSRAVR